MKYIYYLVGFLFLSSYLKDKNNFDYDTDDLDQDKSVVQTAINSGLTTVSKARPIKNPNNFSLSNNDKKNHLVYRNSGPDLHIISRPDLSRKVYVKPLA